MKTKENRKDLFVVGAIIALVVCFIAASVVTVIWLSKPEDFTNNQSSKYQKATYMNDDTHKQLHDMDFTSTDATPAPTAIPTRAPEQCPVKDPEQRPQASVGGGATNPENSADPQVKDDPMKNATVYHFVDKNVRSLSMRVSANKTELLLLAYGIGQLPADGISEDGEKISDISWNE